MRGIAKGLRAAAVNGFDPLFFLPVYLVLYELGVAGTALKPSPCLR